MSSNAEEPSERSEWWQKNVEEFESYNMKPYRPPRFETDELVPEMISELESEHGVTVRLSKLNPTTGDSSWDIIVDGDRIGSIDRRRVAKGYTVYRSSGDEFVSTVEAHLAEVE